FGFSVIFITHDLSLLLEIADQIAVMYAGRIVEMASQVQLYRQPCHPYTNGLMHSFPNLHGPRRTMTGIPGAPPDLRMLPSGCAFHPRCPFKFDVCSSIVPTLLTPFAESAAQRVACHLYDRKLNPSGIPGELQCDRLEGAGKPELAVHKGDRE